MSRCIIHIGMRKTGSSSIQQSLNGFADGRFAYADLGGHPNHGGPLYSSFADDAGMLGSHRRTGRSAVDLGKYIQEVRTGLERSIETAAGRTIIYSGEVSSHLFKHNELCRLRDYFMGRFERVDIVGYIRPPAAYIGSNFQQRVKDAASRINLEVDYFAYRNNLSKFDDIFGREHVQLWKFEPAAFPGGCVVRDFCSRLGIDFPAERIVRVNESLSREAVALLFTYRKLGRDMGSLSMSGRENRGLVEQLRDIGRAKFRFSPDVLRPVLEKHRADIEWMQARLGQSLHEELGEHQPGDVRDESDLLKVNPELVSRLMSMLGDRTPAGITGATPKQVAVLIHALRGQREPAHRMKMGKIEAAGQASGRLPVTQGATPMKVSALIEHMQQTNPKLLNGIPENKAQALVRNVFKRINDTLAGAEDGVVNYEGLGRFRVRKVEKEVDGKKIARTQIIFLRAEPGKGKETDGGEAGN